MNRLSVVKIGGKLIEDENKFTEFLKDFAQLEGPRILIHGGGKMATEMAQKLGHETQMVDGRRITDENSLKVIIMTYGGLINKTIVGRLQGLGCNSIGLCGADGMSLVSKRRAVGEIDFGFVGDIEKVNVSFISSLLSLGITPIFSAISCTREGALLNTNGDSVAAEIAQAMSTGFDTELFYCFEKKGVLANSLDDNSVIEVINPQSYRNLLENKVITDGMLPKLLNCFQALDQGVSKIYLGDFGILKKNASYTKIVN